MDNNELKEVLEGIKNEIIDSIGLELKAINDRLQVVEYKVDRANEKINNLDLRVRNTESNIRRDLRKLSDDNDTMIEVLKQHEFIPR